MSIAVDRPPRTGARGRPSKDEAKLLRARIRAVALREFRQHGYAGTSIDRIARAASVSRTTIYALYSDKPTLFTDIVRTCVATTDLIGRVRFDDRPPQIVLREAMTALNGAYQAEPNLEIMRLCIGETERFPAFIEAMRDLLAATLDGLAQYFERLQRDGCMIMPDARRMALFFNMLALGSLAPLFVSRELLGPETLDGHIELALAFFVRGCLAETPLV